MKNITIVIDALTGGGAEKVVLTLSAEFIRLGNTLPFYRSVINVIIKFRKV